MILQTESVTKRFGGLLALDTVSLSVEQGEIFGLIGPNGAGKTTLLNVIAGIYEPTAGIVKFKDKQITGLNSETICRKGIARTFQICQPFPKMTALENVLVAAVFGNRKAIADPQAWAEELLEFVKFAMPRDTLARNLNTVQLKRLDLARALASNPELLLLDEIAAGLTPGELLELMDLVRKIREERNVTIVLVEHVMKVIMGICDRVAVLHYGQKIAEGTYVEVAKDKKVIDAYLGEKYLL
ncbi:MAG: ABC transporter ATP-binding protein [Chloroflexi bacterium]|nr:ABC transporter ATP-binding protein [Chloroflexota bacterium]